MKAPSWFKLKVERRDVLQSVPPSVAINALMACFDYLDTGAAPDMGALERVVFAALLPDLKEAAGQYEKRVTARTKGNEQHRMTSYDVIRPHMTSYETEQEEEPEEEKEAEEDISPSDEGGDKRARARKHPRFLPPTVEEVAEYVKQRGSAVDPQGFVDFYAAKGWMIGKTPMKDWKAACRNAEGWERWTKATKGSAPGKRPSPETDERAKASMERLRKRMERAGAP